MNNKETVSTNSQNWLEWLNAQYNCSGCDLSHFAVSLTAGLMTGLLLKTHGKQILLILCSTALILFLLHYTHTITIHMVTLNSYIGLPKNSSLQDIVTILSQWAKEHVLLCLTSFVGFLLGWRLG
jgi:uncharacterized membrane protein (Fun14 family)